MKPRLPKNLFSAVLSVLTIGAIAPASGASHTWNGTGDNIVWNDTSKKTKVWLNGKTEETWSDVSEGDTITFGSGSEINKDILVKSNDITVATNIVFEDTYAVSSTKTINAQSVSFNGGSSFTLVNTSGSSADDSLLVSGDVTVKNDYTFYMDKTIDWQIGGSLVIDSDKALTLAVAEKPHTEAGGKALIEAAKIDLRTGSSLTVDNNVTFIITNGGSLESAITNSGTLEMGGSFKSTGMNVIKGTATHYSEGDNGFAVTEGDKIIVVTGTGALSATGVTLTQDDVVYTLNDKTGVAQAAETTDYTTYFLNSGDGSVAAMKTASGNKLTTVELASEETLTVNAAVKNVNVAKDKKTKATITEEGSITNLTMAENSDLLVTTDKKVTLNTLTLKSGAEVTVSDHKGAVALQNLTVTGENTTINADLAIGGGTMTMSGSVEMGCSVSLGLDSNGLASKEALTLTNGSVNAENQLESYILFTGVDSLTLGTLGEVSEGWYDASTVISSITVGTGAITVVPANCVIGYWNGTVSVADKTLPEPATATLSLLALAGLAARRRRK